MDKGPEIAPGTAPPYPGPPVGVYQAQPGPVPGKTSGTIICVF